MKTYSIIEWNTGMQRKVACRFEIREDSPTLAQDSGFKVLETGLEFDVARVRLQRLNAVGSDNDAT